MFLRCFFLVLFAAATSSADDLSIRTIGGTGVSGYSGDGAPAHLARLNNPYGICVGPDSALYICDMDNHVIRRIKDDRIGTVAGNGTRGYSGDGGPALAAQLNEPYEVRFDADGNMFFVEMRNHLVRRVDARTRRISTVAGGGKPGFGGDGAAATNALLNQPHSIQLDAHGHLFICDIGNHRVRQVDLKSGVISTFAGTGEKKNPRDGGRWAEEPLFGPRAIDFDRAGNMWLALREGNSIYKLNLQAGTIHHMAGTGVKGFRDGVAREAELSGPKGLSVAPDGNVYFADTESHSLRRINQATGRVETVAGTGESGDGPEGNPLQCKFARPHGIFVAPDGKIYLGDSENHRVRILSARE